MLLNSDCLLPIKRLSEIYHSPKSRVFVFTLNCSGLPPYSNIIPLGTKDKRCYTSFGGSLFIRLGITELVLPVLDWFAPIEELTCSCLMKYFHL